MIQRKQTLYLIIIILLMGITFLIPSSQGIIESASKEYYNLYKIFPFGVYGEAADSIGKESLFSTTYLGVAICFVIGWCILIISRFKNRWLQIRLTIFLMIWLAGVEALMVAYGYKLITALNETSTIQNDIPVSWGAILPLLSIIFAYLAFRGILKDEILIKTLNSNRMR